MLLQSESQTILDLDDGGPQLVVVLDTSTLIQTKRAVPTGEQWDFYAQMLTLVEQGRLVFPREVARETSQERFPDAPGAWCAKAAKLVKRANPAEDTYVALIPHVADLVDDSAEYDNEPADPYVVAMAHELKTEGFDVAVATDDVVDRLPLKIALTTACQRLDIVHWQCPQFVAWVRQSVLAGA